MSEVKALSLWNPWAFLVMVGAKRIETRGYGTSWRGLLAIHATKAFPPGAIALCHSEPFKAVLKAHGIRYPADLPRGAIIAVANLHRVGRIGRRRDGQVYVEGHDLPTTGNELAFGNYEPNRWGWVLTNVRPLPEPIPCRGSLSLWEVPEEIVDQIRTALGGAL